MTASGNPGCSPVTALTCTSDFEDDAKAEALISGFTGGIVVDTGASHHFTSERSKLSNYIETDSMPIKAANGQHLYAIGKGDLTINLQNGDSETKVTLKEAYYVPYMAYTLFSVQTID